MSSISFPNSSSGSKRPLDRTSSAEFNSDSERTQKCPRTDGESSIPVRTRPAKRLLQFFVRNISSNPPTLVLRAKANARISFIFRKIESLTGIPVGQQRLIYQGKELQKRQTLKQCKVKNDAVLQLVGRLKSSKQVRVCELANDIIDHAISLYRNHQMQISVPQHSQSGLGLKVLVYRFFMLAAEKMNDLPENLKIFIDYSGPQALVMLYTSSSESNEYFGELGIRLFTHCMNIVPAKLCHKCMPLVIEFCLLLRRVKGINDSVYRNCRSCVAELASYMPGHVEEEHGLVFSYLIPFVVELAGEISHHLEEGVVMTPSSNVDFREHVNDFCTFLIPVRKRLLQYASFLGGPFRIPMCRLPPELANEITHLHQVFGDLLSKLERKMLNVNVHKRSGSSRYITILKELHGISKLYHGCEELFWEAMKRRQDAFFNLIIKYAHIMKDGGWILEVKEETKFEVRRALALMVLPRLKKGKYSMLIDRSDLLSMSFHYIGSSDLTNLRADLFVQFKDEEALGFGVLREWFLLVCQEIFNPDYGLFVASPSNRRRFFPNAESELDPLHLQHFRFSGRLIALALMHKLQVGITLDRVFFLQLAGQGISLDDIKDTDPVLYSSCKQILDLDPAILDQDGLNLTFSHEVGRYGTRELIELCPGGSSTAVNSKNRMQYVTFLIKQVFVEAINEQVANFAQGFVDIVRHTWVRESFFQSLYLEDLDLMLLGDESEISVDDWRAHTDYHGFESSDHQISWFWEIVRGMSKEQRKILLFFWTSIKNLPFKGFSGLASRLSILKTSESLHRLPSSHTCFYQLCCPVYGSFTVMRDRIHMITQEHICCSFGIE